MWISKHKQFPTSPPVKLNNKQTSVALGWFSPNPTIYLVVPDIDEHQIFKSLKENESANLA